MLFFITVLRALAACLITNAHYEGVYPTDVIANGGLIGDVLFFAVSGYCLYNIKLPFRKWYVKRLYRIYPPVFLMTFIYMLLGFYTIQENSLFWWYVYPTYYHFVASIVVLYVFYYMIMKIEWLRNHLIYVMGSIAFIWLIYYWLFYDKSYYHIDTVREPIIRVLFFESMLLGAWFRQNDCKIRNIFRVRYIFETVSLFGLYFVSKLIFVRYEQFSKFQFVNQVLIFMLLFVSFRLFCSLDSKLEKLPQKMKKIISLISKLTLEIYVVQYVPIREIRECIPIFPLNWIVITGVIALLAILLNRTCNLIYRKLDNYIDKW